MSGFQEIVVLEKRAQSLYTEGRHHEAVATHGQALKIAENIGRHHLIAVIFNRVGEIFEADSQIQRAVKAYESGLNALAGDLHSDLAPVINALQMVAKGYDSEYKFLEVLDLYTETAAEDLKEAEADSTLAIKLLINIGNAYLRMPQLNPALNAYEQALQRPEVATAPVLQAHALTHIAIIQRRRDEIDQAKANLKKSLRLLDQHAAPEEKSRALNALASIQRQCGENELAAQHYRQALDLYRQSDDNLGEARALAGLGHIHLQRQELTNAKDVFQRAVDLARKTRDEDTLWHTYWGLGICQHQAKELQPAAQSFRRCLDKIKLRRRELRTDEGKVTFMESVQEIYDRLIAVHLDRGAHESALQIAEEARGQALFDLMGLRRRRFQSKETGFRSTRQRSFSRRIDGPKQDAQGILSGPGAFNPAVQMAPAVQAAPAVDILANLNDPVWHEDTLGLSDMLENARAIPSTIPRWPEESTARESVAPDLAPLTHLIFHVLADRTAIFVVTPEGRVQGAVAALGQDAIAERVTTIRQALQVDKAPRGVRVIRDARPQAADNRPVDFKQPLRELYAALIEPIADLLPTDGSPIVIEPSAALWLLPFAALIAADGSWLADCWPLLYSPSTEVLKEIRMEPDYGGPKDLKALVIGNPTMPTLTAQDDIAVELQPLPGAEQEASIVGNLLAESGSKILKGKNADWASVIALLPQHGILHFASHGIAYSKNPLASFIALSAPDQAALDALQQQQPQANWPQNQFLADFVPDEAQTGLLTARQILYLPLPADLVTLSACQTGLGQISGDGMIGLSRAFLVAGARSVLVSQWSVSDEATVALMDVFYQGYLELDDKALALQRAMYAIRSQPEYAHPRYWAPFVIVGAEA